MEAALKLFQHRWTHRREQVLQDDGQMVAAQPLSNDFMQFLNGSGRQVLKGRFRQSQEFSSADRMDLGRALTSLQALDLADKFAGKVMQEHLTEFVCCYVVHCQRYLLSSALLPVHHEG